MSDGNAFRDGAQAPTANDLRRVLGTRAAYWRELAEHVAVVEEWKYYGKTYGWTLKLLAGKRNLCFLTARDGWFVAGFVFGDKAVQAVAASVLPRELVDELLAAKKYAEGRGIRVPVKSRRALASAKLLLGIKHAFY